MRTVRFSALYYLLALWSFLECTSAKYFRNELLSEVWLQNACWLLVTHQHWTCLRQQFRSVNFIKTYYVWDLLEVLAKSVFNCRVTKLSFFLDKKPAHRLDLSLLRDFYEGKFKLILVFFYKSAKVAAFRVFYELIVTSSWLVVNLNDACSIG